jgi:hypothetical protein
LKCVARFALVVLAVAACALAPGVASAARPGTLIGPGQAPSIAVDAAGTGYVVWNDDGAIGPVGQVLFVDDNSLDGILSQFAGIGAPANDTATLIDPPPGLNAPAAFAGNTPVVVGAGAETKAAIYSGSGDPNDGASWNNVRVPGSTFNPSLASGPRGLFLIQDTGTNEGRLTVRRFQGKRFGPAHIVHKTNFTEGTALAEDAHGRLVAIWYEEGKLFAAASRSGGLHWARSHMIATDVENPGRMQAVLGPDGRGWLVYELESGSQIRLVPLNTNHLLGIKPAPKKHKPPHHKKHHPNKG